MSFKWENRLYENKKVSVLCLFKYYQKTIELVEEIYGMLIHQQITAIKEDKLVHMNHNGN